MTTKEWVLKRNCSLSPSQLLCAYLVLCAAPMVIVSIIAITVSLHGAWYVLAFAILEMCAVGVAFAYYARHVTDRERIVLTEHLLLVESTCAGVARQVQMQRALTQVEVVATGACLIRLQAGELQIHIGGFLNAYRRRAFACELDQALHSSATTSA